MQQEMMARLERMIDREVKARFPAVAQLGARPRGGLGQRAELASMPAAGQGRQSGPPTTSVVTRRVVALSGPSPDSAEVTCPASPGLAEVDSARPMMPAPLSTAGAMSSALAMTCVLAPPPRASAQMWRLSGESAEPRTSMTSDADAITRMVCARSDAA